MALPPTGLAEAIKLIATYLVLETVDFGAEGPFKHVPVSARISTIITTI
jgi:hypothetical protein